MTEVVDFVRSISGFHGSTAVDQLLALAWFAENRQRRSTFDGALMRSLFRAAGVEPPDMSLYLARLSAKKPPQLLKEKGGYRLAGETRRSLDTRLGGDPTVMSVSKSLTDLPLRIPDLAERDFLTEALNCYRVRAYRAAVVMTWNLTYDHVVRWVCADTARLNAFNAGLVSKYPKKNIKVTKIEDIDDLKEFEFVEAARTGGVLDKNSTQILREKLARRNMAAHPSRVTIAQHSADDMISDLVTNIILKCI